MPSQGCINCAHRPVELEKRYMQGEPANTPENKLGPGITEEQIEEAVRRSGYPLQTTIASSLRMDFIVQEEWSYLDKDTGALRTLDIWASRRMNQVSNDTQPLIRPTLDLLIECKQSDLPFVFFLSAGKPHLRDFPYFAGLFQDTIALTTDDDLSTYNQGILSALGLENHPFLGNAAETCMSLSKCVRKGKEIELSGTEAYQHVILPLVKALQYFKKQEQPPNTARYFDCHIPFAIAIIDAPMIAVRIRNNSHSLSLIPWVRVVRNEAVEAEHWYERMRSYAIDVIHRYFFDVYLQRHLIPFAQAFTPLALKHHVELATGKGFACGLGSNWMTNIEERLRPRS